MTGNKIKKLRLAKGWTQRELAAMLGVAVRTVQYWEEKGCSKALWMAIQGLK